MGPNLMDEIDHLFDQIDDFIEFPPDIDCDGNLVSSDCCKDIPSMWSEPLLPGGGGSSSSHDNPASNLDLSTELSVPYEDVVQLEWLSTFVEDSYAGGGLTIGKDNFCANNEPWHSHCQTLSPVSVLESSSSSSCSGEKIPAPRGPQRARSKRPRPATFNPRPPIQPFIETPQHLFIGTGISAESSENFAESQPVKKMKIPKAEPKKTKKIKIISEENEDHHQNPPPVRKCLHCEITKTPQWRAGPLGPKTLCNACGVRYKSGRLFPEYRPAASPTFVPSIHSNSHKKVLEMRNNTVATAASNP